MDEQILPFLFISSSSPIVTAARRLLIARISSFQGASIYNNLPSDVRIKSTLSILKGKHTSCLNLEPDCYQVFYSFYYIFYKSDQFTLNFLNFNRILSIAISSNIFTERLSRIKNMIH